MADEPNEPVVIWVGLTDDILYPEPDGPTSAPVVLSAEDTIELLSTFQHLVYSTAMLTYGLNSTQHLRANRRYQYELVVAATSTGSFFFGFRSHDDAEDPARSDKNIIATVEWVFAFLERLEALPDDVLNLAPSAAVLIADIMQSLIEAHLGHQIVVAQDQVAFLVGAVIAWIKYGKARNHPLSIRQDVKRPWKTLTPKQTDAVLRAEGAIGAPSGNQVADDSIEQREFNWSRGDITESDPSGHRVYMHFPQYPRDVRCRYDPAEGHMFSKLKEGDVISVRGTAYHLRSDSQGDVPMTIHIKDWSVVDHSYSGFLKD